MENHTISFSFPVKAQGVDPWENTSIPRPVFREDTLANGFYIINGIKGIRMELLDDPNDMGEILPFDNGKDHLHFAGPSFTIDFANGDIE